MAGGGPVFLEMLNCNNESMSLDACHSFSRDEPPTCEQALAVGIQCRG